MLKDPSRMGDIDYAEVEDATKAFLHVVSDPDTTGSYYVQSSPVQVSIGLHEPTSRLTRL